MAETTPSTVTMRTRDVAFVAVASFALLAIAAPALAGLPGTPTPTPPIFTASGGPSPTITPTTPIFTASGGPSPTITPTPTPSPIVTPTATFTSVIHTSPTGTPTTPLPTVPPSGTQAPTNTPTPLATPSPGGTPCGNSVIDPGETCDPPGSLQPPNDNPCRADCTYCGDGITQASGGEICDDGNSVSGCRPDRPQQALDACLNACRFPICEDPSRIQLFPDQNDVVQVHGRLMAPTAVEFEDGEFRVRIARQVCTHDTTVGCATDAQCDALSSGSTCTPNDPASVVFEQAIAGSAIDGNGKRWRYKNPAAKTDGGIYLLKITAKTKKKICGGSSNAGARCTTAADCPQGDCLGYYVLKLKAYGTATGAVSDMQTVIQGGGYAWAVRGIWQEFPKGWRLYKKSVLLDPWL